MKDKIEHPISLLNSTEETEIINAIKEAEKNTSGEIRVHITYKENTSSFNYAKEVFNQFKLYKTEQRNAVLILISAKERTFTILGDTGIDKVVKQEFWDSVKNNVIEKFKLGNYFDGILFSVNVVGHKLKEYFPWDNNDKNEIPDEIFYS